MKNVSEYKIGCRVGITFAWHALSLIQNEYIDVIWNISSKEMGNEETDMK